MNKIDKLCVAPRRPKWMNKRAWEASKSDPSTMVFKCEPISDLEIAFDCPFCRRTHVHGRGRDGFRASHCDVFKGEYIVAENQIKGK